MHNMSAAPAGRVNRRRLQESLCGYSFILPLVIGIGVFYLYGVVKVIIDSFYNVGAFNIRSFAGLSNYKALIADADVWSALLNTVLYVIIIVPATVILALILANLLNRNIKGRPFFRVVYFLPAVTMSTAVGMVWKWLYNRDFGLINAIFKLFGLGPFNFLSQTNYIPLICISIVQIWISTGYNMIILLAGLQGIPKTYYEAASLDGASSLKQFFHITVPLITPTLFFVMITTTIGVFQTFDIIYLMISRISPAVSHTDSLLVYFYRYAFVYSKKGYASAIAVLLFVIVMAVTVIQLKIQKKWTNYG